jgi:hypothetical protein
MNIQHVLNGLVIHVTQIISFVLQQLYKDMENRINAATKIGKVPEIFRQKHKGFSEWNEQMTSRDHQGIIQVLTLYHSNSKFIHFFFGLICYIS